MIIFPFRREYFRIDLHKKIFKLFLYQSLKYCTTKTKKLIYKQQLNIVENTIVDAAFSQKKNYQICFFITKKENNWQPSITIKNKTKNSVQNYYHARMYIMYNEYRQKYIFCLSQLSLLLDAIRKYKKFYLKKK